MPYDVCMLFWDYWLACLLLGELLFIFLSCMCLRPRAFVIFCGIPNEYKWGCRNFLLISSPFCICLSRFFNIHSDIYFSTFSVQPGFSRASKPIKLVFSIRAILIISFRPQSEILLPETLITFKYLSKIKAFYKFFAKTSLNLFRIKISSLRPEAYKIRYFL